MTIIKNIDNEILTKLEKTYYELNMRSHIIERLIDLHSADKEFINSPLFKKYEEQYCEAYIAYETIKNLFNDYLREILMNEDALLCENFDWEVQSFALNTVRIDIND